MWYRKIRTSARSLGKDESGANAVEFALIAPVLLFLILGIIQFGMILYTHNGMMQAAREATRVLAKEAKTTNNAQKQEQARDDAETRAREQLALFSGLTFDPDACAPGTAATCQPPDWLSPDPLKDVSVKITVPISNASLIDILGLFTTGDLITATVTMRMQE